MIAGVRRPTASAPEPALATAHLVAVVVAEQVEQPVDERALPGRADHLGTQHHVAELTGHGGRKLLAAVDREREHIRRLVDSEVVSLQRPDLAGSDERKAEIARVDALGRERAAAQGEGALLVDRHAAPVLELDLDHERRSVPVSSAWLR